MNIVYVQSRPVFQDTSDNATFLNQATRDLWMPSITTQKGFPSELWATGKEAADTEWEYDNLPPVPVRIFVCNRREANCVDDASDSLNSAALQAHKKGLSGSFSIRATDETETPGQGRGCADLFVINGTGSVGVSLAEKVLIPQGIPFVVISSSPGMHPVFKHARLVLIDSDRQKSALTRRSWQFWRFLLHEDQVVRLPKSTDTRHFAPDKHVERVYDLMALVKPGTPDKQLNQLFALSRYFNMAIFGEGTPMETWRNTWPEIDWLGNVPYEQLPEMYNKARLFVHLGPQNPFPQAIVQAASSGLPPVVMAHEFDEDLLPSHVSLRVSKRNYEEEIRSLLAQPQSLMALSGSARAYAEKEWHHLSTSKALTEMIRRCK